MPNEYFLYDRLDCTVVFIGTRPSHVGDFHTIIDVTYIGSFIPGTFDIIPFIHS